MQPPLVVLTGATAVGKTELALALAARLDAEIVSADSRQVYRYMDVGTAKPSAAERAAVPHHLVDVAYPDQPYSVVEYQRAATRTLAAIAARGRPALLVGGSPHYLQAVVDRIQPAGGSRPLRAWLERADAGDRGHERLDAWLRALDPEAAERIDRQNRRRVLRALEVTLANGYPFSQVGRTREAALPATWIGLRRPRPALHARIGGRIAAMLAAGWLDEVRVLLAMGFAPTLPAMSATGYREMVRVVRGELELTEAVTQVQRATNAFVRRQETWLRADPRVHWLDADAPNLVDQALVAIETDAQPAER
ncbi:MAG: tRNA dimethylallyltransferase [Chloroflexota bacterium]|jgi:tRNA dimethylallyltransferase|nr:tRNA dimethylallyltransferase [Chloroflexota bacterium]